MFKKRSKPNKASLRRKKREEDEDDEDDATRQNLQEAVRATKKLKTSDSNTTESSSTAAVMHSYATSKEKLASQADLATSTAQHHPQQQESQGATKATTADDGIFRDTTRNKFLAGPIKAATFVRTTCQFDYQPDVCKDYKDTGFCGFGDTCIYLHDRGDYLTGWQLEQQYEEQRKKELQQKELAAFSMGGDTTKQQKDDATKSQVKVDDGLPFACHVCREAFTDPVVTACGHYFCEKCIMSYVRENDNKCPICNKDTQGVFNQPTKLLMKKRKLLSSKATWQEFMDASRPPPKDVKGE